MKQGTKHRVSNTQVRGGKHYQYGKAGQTCRHCGQLINFVRVPSATKKKVFRPKNPDGTDHTCKS